MERWAPVARAKPIRGGLGAVGEEAVGRRAAMSGSHPDETRWRRSQVPRVGLETEGSPEEAGLRGHHERCGAAEINGGPGPSPDEGKASSFGGGGKYDPAALKGLTFE